MSLLDYAKDSFFQEYLDLKARLDKRDSFTDSLEIQCKLFLRDANARLETLTDCLRSYESQVKALKTAAIHFAGLRDLIQREVDNKKGIENGK